MKETGNWILPHLNGEVYAEKPPLSFWLVNLSTFFLGRNNELANRLPSALAGLIILLVTFLLQKTIQSQSRFLSAMVLGTCILFPQLSRWMMLDSLFTLFFLLALFCFYLGYEKEQRRRRITFCRPLYRACHLDEKAGRLSYASYLFDLCGLPKEDEGVLVPRPPPGISSFRDGCVDMVDTCLLGWRKRLYPLDPS